MNPNKIQFIFFLIFFIPGVIKLYFTLKRLDEAEERRKQFKTGLKQIEEDYVDSSPNLED